MQYHEEEPYYPQPFFDQNPYLGNLVWFSFLFLLLGLFLTILLGSVYGVWCFLQYVFGVQLTIGILASGLVISIVWRTIARHAGKRRTRWEKMVVE